MKKQLASSAKPPACLYLIGARASGKTCIGHLLSQSLNWFFIDTDAALQARCGQSISELVAAQGWPAFRAEESETLRACYAPQTVFATGGGMVLTPENRAFMRQHGLVVYLSAPPEVLVQRLCAHPLPNQRPSLLPQAPNLEAEVEALLLERQPLYLACAHLTIDAAQAPPAVVKAILNTL